MHVFTRGAYFRHAPVGMQSDAHCVPRRLAGRMAADNLELR
jgi:hypothetical protein